MQEPSVSQSRSRLGCLLGTLSPSRRQDFRPLRPISLAVTVGGVIYAGFNWFVARLAPEGSRYQVDWLATPALERALPRSAQEYGACFSPYLVRARSPRTCSSADLSPARSRLQCRCT